MKNFYNFLFSVATAGFLLVLFATALAFGTFIENSYGTEAARSLVYNSWWLELIMIVLSVNMVANFIRHKMYRKKKLTMGIFHLAFILVILGAGVTRYFGREGIVHIREGETTNILVSNETRFNFAASFQSEQKGFSEPASVTVLAANKLSDQIKIGGKEISVKSVNYFVDAQRSIQSDPQGEPMIDLVYAQQRGMKSELLHVGQVINANGITIGFNTAASVRFILRGDSLKLVSGDTIRSTNMQSQEAPPCPPGTEMACKDKMIYQVAGTSLVVKKIPSSRPRRCSCRKRNTNQ